MYTIHGVWFALYRIYVRMTINFHVPIGQILVQIVLLEILLSVQMRIQKQRLKH